jgi:glycosyltransferase involved in cell wall biosynthesis
MQFDLDQILATEYLGQTKPVNQIKPLVSVCVITYNHETYIEKCIESILAQKTNFDFEILIGEDNSTDKTREICKAYAEKHPDKIRLFLRTPDQKIDVDGKKTWHFNFAAHLYTSTAKYIAWCDGDDYWTFDGKLQKQFDELEAHPEYVMNHHHFDKIFPDGKRIPTKVKPKIEADTKDIIENFQIRMCTMMFRNIFQEHPLPTWFYKNQVGDRPMSIHLSRFGLVHYIKDNWAVYHADSSASVLKTTRNNRHALSINMYAYFLADADYTPYKSTLLTEILGYLRKEILELIHDKAPKKEVEKNKALYNQYYKELKNKSFEEVKKNFKFKAKSNLMILKS